MAKFTFGPRLPLPPPENPLLKRSHKSCVQLKSMELMCPDCGKRWPYHEPGAHTLFNFHVKTKHPETWAIWNLIEQIDSIGKESGAPERPA
jgi:hypothetical protein